MTVRVGILPHADHSHLIPCFRICRELRKWGNEVRVLGSNVVKLGRGHDEVWGNQLTAFGLSGRQVVHRDEHVTMFDWLIRQLKELELDILILDAVWQGLAYGCQDANILSSVVVHHAGLPDFRSTDMPAWSAIHPGHSKNKWEQQRNSIEQREQKGYGIRRMMSFVKALSPTGRTTKDDFDFGCGEFANLPATRAMSWCPAAEFPEERGRMEYFGTLLPKPEDIDWRPVPAEMMDNAKDLIACVFGTTGLQSQSEYEWLFALARSLADTFLDCNVVVVVPDRAMAWMTYTQPKNLILYSWIPLWELLSTWKGRKVLVTTPGVGAFREAIASGTPIVAIPRRLDQFGAAARVEYFGVGTSLVSPQLPDPGAVVQHVAHALEDSAVRVRTQHLQQEFAAFDATQPLKRFIE